jgi:hypothetical protein
LTVKVMRALPKNIDVTFLPPYTSHFLQPLDDICFAIYKTKIAAIAARLNKAFGSRGFAERGASRSTHILTLASFLAEKLAFEKSKIQKSFKRTGIYPWNKALVLKNARINSGIAKSVMKPEFVLTYSSDQLKTSGSV